MSSRSRIDAKSAQGGGPPLSVTKLLWINIFVLATTLAFITFHTWGVLHRVLDQEGNQQKTRLGGPSIATAKRPSPFGLVVPDWPATALPSVRTTVAEEASLAKKRKSYGGAGDKAHLGGFKGFDACGVSPTLWTGMVNYLGIKSVLDVGCGRGISTSWFALHGLEYVACVEGSHDAVEQSILPGLGDVPSGTKVELVEHDFSRGPWWPSQTVDAVWCVEFTEHVGRNFQPNYLTAWRKAGLIFMTHSRRGGWHHVEVHDSDWWILRMETMGFVYAEKLTKRARGWAWEDRDRKDIVPEGIRDSRETHNIGQHLLQTLLVFINPLVTSRLEHAHLLAEHGCYSPANGWENGAGQECGKRGLGGGVAELTPLPEDFKPLRMTKRMDDRWAELIQGL